MPATYFREKERSNVEAGLSIRSSGLGFGSFLLQAEIISTNCFFDIGEETIFDQ
jgi:hypothetical protein